MNKITEEELKRQIQAHDIISFDVFDTLLIRKTLFPQDVFEMVAEKISMTGISLLDYKNIRIKAETENYDYDHTIKGVYQNFKDLAGVTESISDQICQFELDTEAEILVGRTRMVDMFNYAKSLGKRVFLLSDMYLTQDFLGKIVEDCGIKGYEEFWISCEYGKSKYDGLFDIFKDKINGESYLHIGDNERVDGYCANQSGIDSFIIRSVREMAESANMKMQDLTLQERRNFGERIAIEFDNPFQ